MQNNTCILSEMMYNINIIKKDDRLEIKKMT